MKKLVHLTPSERLAAAVIMKRAVDIQTVGGGTSYRMVNILWHVTPYFQRISEAQTFMAALTQERIIVHLFTRCGTDDEEHVTHLVDPVRLLAMLERCDAAGAAQEREPDRPSAPSP